MWKTQKNDNLLVFNCNFDRSWPLANMRPNSGEREPEKSVICFVNETKINIPQLLDLQEPA